MRYQTFELFPTTILKFDLAGVFTKEEIDLMINDVNQICNIDNLMQINEQTPKHQSKPILFQENIPPYWQKLKQSFLQCCKSYLEIVDKFTLNQDTLEFTHARAWFYKGWKSLNETQVNPWHNHNPSFLSGVFYLKLPEESKSSGTEFSDPRVAESHCAANQSVEGTEYTWVIFPGWLYHKSGNCDTEVPRITIAADSYVKVL